MIKIICWREADPELPAGEKSIFTSSAEAIDAIERQADREEAGFLEAHIDFYYSVHEDRFWEETGEGSLRFMNGQCQVCKSTEGYTEETELCAAHSHLSTKSTPLAHTADS